MPVTPGSKSKRTSRDASTLTPDWAPEPAPDRLVVIAEPGAEISERLQTLLSQLKIPVVGDEPQSDQAVLLASGDRLSLRVPSIRGDIHISGADIERRGRGASDLARACISHRGCSILDAMAGLGVDSGVLASRGCVVDAVERQPLIAAMLADLGDRLDDGRTVAHVAEQRHNGQLRIHHADALDVLGQGTWDVVYLDPMFPARGKSALPGKRLQAIAAVLAQSLDEDEDVALDSWLEQAAASARRRVVLKRRLKDPVLGKPSGAVRGRAVRFDIYPGAAGG